MFNDEVLRVGGHGVMVLDFTVWGWVHIVIGLVMMLIAYSLYVMRGWARWAAVAIAVTNAIAQVVALTAFPLWGLMAVALDVIVIYQLTARWND